MGTCPLIRFELTSCSRFRPISTDSSDAADGSFAAVGVPTGNYPHFQWLLLAGSGPSANLHKGRCFCVGAADLLVCCYVSCSVSSSATISANSSKTCPMGSSVVILATPRNILASPSSPIKLSNRCRLSFSRLNQCADITSECIVVIVHFNLCQHSNKLCDVGSHS